MIVDDIASANMVGQKFYHEKYGEYEVIEYLGRKDYNKGHHYYYNIKFKNTGTIAKARSSEIKYGRVQDNYARTVAGIGYLGDIDDLVYDRKMYDMWNSMIDKNYNKETKMFPDYGEKGVTVCERWHCFANFVEDFYHLKGFEDYINAEPSMRRFFCIDKDILQPDKDLNEKEYGPDTCCITYIDYNTRESRARYRDRCDCGSKYFGVSIGSNGLIQTSITIMGKYYYLGTYDNEIAAANVYNYVAERCEAKPFLNDAPYMEINEALSHCTSKKPITFPSNIDTKDLVIPYKNHSKLYGVKKKRNNFIGIYHDAKVGVKEIGIFDSEQAAASAHNHYTRLFGSGIGKINEESEDFKEMSLAETLFHRTYTKATEPKVMYCNIDKETGEKTYYSEFTYKTKYPPIKATKPGRYEFIFELNGKNYFCGVYKSREAAIVIWNILCKYYNLPYDKRDITMTLQEAVSYLYPGSHIDWPEGFNVNNINIPNNRSSIYAGVTKKQGENSYRVTVDRKSYGTFTNEIAAANAYNWCSHWYGTNNQYQHNNVQYMKPEEWIQYKSTHFNTGYKGEQLYSVVNQDEEARKARCKAIYGIDI